MSLLETEQIQGECSAIPSPTNPSNKNKPSNLELLIDSERYELKELLGRGCWGVVYAAYDKILEEEVAIKILSPNQIGLEQMNYRKLDEFNAMRKEGGKLTACANIVPRRFELDKKGKPFIVMPKYNKFFSNILKDAFDSRSSRKASKALGEKKLFGSGLSIDEIIKYSRDIVNGIAEIHKVYKKAYCDLKPDNLALDNDGKLLISDMGTSTYASFAITSAPRDNMGFLYTRSPRLFIEGEHPKKSSDSYAFGCLLYKMFTGEYPFEKEINEAMKKGGLKEVKKFMNNFYERIGSFGLFKHNSTIAETIDKKLKKTGIPEPFKRFITNCVQEYCSDGENLKKEFEEAVSQYLEARVKKRAVDEFKAKLKKKLISGIVTGTVIAGLGIGFLWLGYISPKPDYANKTDIITLSKIREFDKSGIILEIDHVYNNDLGNLKLNDDYDNLLTYHQNKYKNKTLVDKIVTEWIKTASEMESEFIDNETRRSVISPVDYHQRHSILFRGESPSMPTVFLNEYIRDLLGYAISINQVSKNVADLEDTLTTTYLGTNLVYKAQKAANSFEFDKYICAKDEQGNYIIPEARQKFLKRLVYNVSVNPELSQSIRLK